MERLTKVDDQGRLLAYLVNDTGLPTIVMKGTPYRKLIERLKAYEDSGLEPCEIPVLLDRLKHASEQWDIWCDAYQKDVPVWIPVAERIPAENEYRVVCAAHSGKPFLRRFEVAYVTDTVGYQFGYYDGYKWIDKSNKEIPNVVAWKNHEPFNPRTEIKEEVE